MDKDVTHTMEYYSVIKKDKILPLAATWMDLEYIMIIKINQTSYSICLSQSLIHGM